MFVCRACAQRWRRPPAVLLSRFSAAGRAVQDCRPSSTSARPKAATGSLAAARHTTNAIQRSRMLFSRSLVTATDTMRTAHKSPTVEEAGLQLREEDDTESRGRSAAATKSRQHHNSQLDAIVKRQLQFLRDPYTIGKHVEKALAKDAYEEALHLTRKASKDHQVVVSWNHLIDYMMRKEKLKTAIKLFNEMKKRGQLPNAQTFTIVFRGCAASPHASTAVYEATRLYYAMLANERIRPNTVHMNAVLQVCARAKDLESLFAVAKTANHSTRTPNNLTYTTVLNGLRFATALPHHRPSAQEGEDEVHLDKEKVSVSINRARAVWEEVVANWRQGRLVVDEELVCAMGRVLLMGDYHDNDDVLSLVEQTMGIPRLDRESLPPALAGKAATSAAETEQSSTAVQDATPTTSTEDASDTATTTSESNSESTAIEAKAPTAKKAPAKGRPSQFTPLPPGIIGSRYEISATGGGAVDNSVGDSTRGASIMYARPGRNVLSLVLTSLGATRKTSLAARYWDVFTRERGVVADSENWFRLLKALRRGHASAKTAELLQRMPPALMDARTFRLAMQTCAADNLNDNVFAHAGQVLDLMNRTLRVPDPHTLRLYLQTTLTNSRRFRDAKATADAAGREAAKFAFGRQIVRALGRLWDPLRRAGNALVAYPGQQQQLLPLQAHAAAAAVAEPEDGGKGKEKLGQAYNERRELMALARQMVSAADMVVTEGMADEATLKDVRTSRNLLNRQITRFYENREKVEPNLRKGRAGGAKQASSRRQGRAGKGPSRESVAADGEN